MTKIVTINNPPPIPCRDFDWVAYRDGEEESGHCGWGQTEAEAIADLKRLDEERAEYEASKFEQHGQYNDY